MGALTSKIHAFKVRPWEIQKFSSVDFFDILGISIYVDVIGNKIFRILNGSLVFWLTDKIRFFFDSININRLVYPIISFWLLKRKINLLFVISWNDVYDYFFSLKTLLKLIVVRSNFKNFFLNCLIWGIFIILLSIRVL